MAELRCDQVVELVTDFLDGALDEATEQDVVEHLAGCDGCQAYVEQFRQTVRTLGELPAEQRRALSPEARAELLAAFRGKGV
jgi:anti-sigma factor RsiW